MMLVATHCYTKAEAARLLHVSPGAVARLVLDGALDVRRVGKRDLITGVSIAQFTGADVPHVPAVPAQGRKTLAQIKSERWRRTIPLS